MAKKTRGKHKPSTYQGLPLVDATEDLEIEIRKGDVASARKKDPAHCAAANAARRELATDVEVHISRIYVKDKKNKRWVRFCTPERISREITSFDRSSIFEPGDYIFKAPSPSARLGNYHSGKKGDGSGKKTTKQRVTMNIRERAPRK